jgi:putative glycosyltransferase (TIGR04372 family)
MTFGEIFQSGAGRFIHTDNYKELGLEVIENTPKEIKDAVSEMEARLDNLWSENKEDEKLQKRFWELFPRSELHGKIRSRIGAAFLRQNIDLLG